MANVATLTAKMAFDIGDFMSKSNAVEGRLKRLGGSAASSSSGVTGLATAFAGGMAGAVAFSAVTTTLTAGLGLLKTAAHEAFEALSFGAKLAAEAEQAQVAFRVLLDSGTAAAKLMKDLEQFAIRTPFGMSGLQDASKTLLGAGVGGDEILPALQTLGEVSGGNVERLKELAIVYGQVQSKGKLLAQDFNQITEKGINMRQALADQVGVSVKDLAKTMEDGKISFADFRNALIEVSETKFGGMMDEQSQTAIGTLDRLKEVSGGLLKDIATDLGQAFSTTDILNDLAGFVEYIRSEWRDEISGAFIFVGTLITKVFDEIIASLNMTMTTLGLMTEIIGKSGAVGGGLTIPLANMGQQLREAGMAANGKSFSAEFAGMLEDFNRLNPKGKPQEGLKKLSTPFDVFGEARKFLLGGEKEADGKKSKGAVFEGSKAFGDVFGDAVRSFSMGFTSAAKGFPDLVDGKFGKKKTEETKKTGALEVGSREAFSEIIRNMFGKSKEEKNLAALRSIKDAVNAVERVIERGMLHGATLVDSFPG